MSNQPIRPSRNFIICLVLLFLGGCLGPFTENTNPPEQDVAWQPNGEVLAVSRTNLRLYTETLQETKSLETGRAIHIAWSLDGNYLVTTGQLTQIWHIKTRQISASLQGKTYSVAAAWSPDNSKIAIGYVDGQMKTWNTAKFDLSLTFDGHKDQVNTIDWSPDSTRLASGSSDGAIKIWDARTGEVLHSIEMPNHISVYSVSWSPDGGRLASGSADQSVRIWDVNTGKLQTSISAAQEPFWVALVVWSPDGKRLLSASSNTLQTWDSVTNQPLITFEGHNGAVDAASWNSDSSKIASVGKDSTIRIWDADTGQLLAVHNLN